MLRMSNDQPYNTGESYYKGELAALYEIDLETLIKWIQPWMKELEAMGYNKNQKRFTVAQVNFLIRDDKLGRPKGLK